MTWFTALSVAEKIYFIIAVVASVLLIIQIIMLLFSLGGGDIDMDGCPDCVDGIDHADGGLSFFSVKSLTAFFALGGWCGFAAQNAMLNNFWAPALIALATGAVALLGVAFAMRGIARLQCSGNIVKHKLVGTTATVYVSIPANRSGRGKITLSAQGRYMELDAMTDEEQRIPVDCLVEIAEYSGDFALVKRAGNPADKD